MRGEYGDIREYTVPDCTLVVFWPHLGIKMGTVSVEEANDTIMGGVQCLNSFL